MVRSAKEIIDEAADLLRTARFGLEDMKTIPGRSKTGLRNAVVFGRNTTWALQNLRSVTPDFELWYRQKQSQMKADPLMRYFHDLRTSIEKKAATPTITCAHIHQFSSSDMKRFEPRPPGAKGFFIGDVHGGSGWLVALPGGSEERYYVQLPPDIAEVNLHLPDAPPLTGVDGNKAVDLVAAYLTKIGAVVAEARQKFVP